MVKAKLPLKFMIVKSLIGFSDKTAENIYDELESEYGMERQFSMETIEYHLQALKTVGIVKVVDVSFGCNNTLTVQYEVTTSGESLIGKSTM